MQVERRKWRAEQKELLDEQLPKATGRYAVDSPATAAKSWLDDITALERLYDKAALKKAALAK